jgi:uncharacterized membrane protein
MKRFNFLKTNFYLFMGIAIFLTAQINFFLGKGEQFEILMAASFILYGIQDILDELRKK